MNVTAFDFYSFVSINLHVDVIWFWCWFVCHIHLLFSIGVLHRTHPSNVYAFDCSNDLNAYFGTCRTHWIDTPRWLTFGCMRQAQSQATIWYRSDPDIDWAMWSIPVACDEFWRCFCHVHADGDPPVCVRCSSSMSIRPILPASRRFSWCWFQCCFLCQFYLARSRVPILIRDFHDVRLNIWWCQGRRCTFYLWIDFANHSTAFATLIRSQCLSQFDVDYRLLWLICRSPPIRLADYFSLAPIDCTIVWHRLPHFLFASLCSPGGTSVHRSHHSLLRFLLRILLLIHSMHPARVGIHPWCFQTDQTKCYRRNVNPS